MSERVAVEDIERIVGTERHATMHYANAVSAEEMVYVLHSQECLDSYSDLRLCPYSKALDTGINPYEWSKNEPVLVEIYQGRLKPAVDA